MTDGGQWLTIPELALRDSITEAYVSILSRRFQAAGLVTFGSKNKRGKSLRLIDTEQWDAARAQLPQGSSANAAIRRQHKKLRLAAPHAPAPSVTADPEILPPLPLIPPTRGGTIDAAGDDSSLKSYPEELARKIRADAELNELKLAKLRSELTPVAEVKQAAERCAEMIVRELEKLPTLSASIVKAFEASGPAGLRAALREYVRQTRLALADSFAQLSTPENYT